MTDNLYESEDKMVSHPNHYKSDAGLEVIDVIAAFTEDLKGIEAVDTGNALKYLCRWSKKGDPIQNIEKAIWYCTHLIKELKKKQSENCKIDTKDACLMNAACLDSEYVEYAAEGVK